jgi:YHS domain-containing protein
MLRSIVRALVLALTATSLMLAQAAPAFAKPQDKCPVMGGPIDKSVYVDQDGKRVYFCCGGCIAGFKADPQKYLKKMEQEGVELEKAPAAPKGK